MSQATELLLVPETELQVPDADGVQGILDLLQVKGISLASAFDHDAEWNTNRPILKSHTNISVPEYMVFASRNRQHCVHAQVDGRLDALGKALRSRYPDAVGDWYPCTGTLVLGLHSYPDLEWEETIWRGHISFGIYGDGMASIGLIREVVAQDSKWRDIAAEIGQALGATMRTELLASY